MRARLPIGCVVVAAAAIGCGSAGGSTTGTGGAGGAPAADPCADTFLAVMGDGLPQRFTATSGKEAAGTLVITGHADAPSDTTITILSDKPGSTTLGHVDYHQGTQSFAGDHATVTITSLGAVGEAVEGSYAGMLTPATVGITVSLSGTFKVCRGADSAM